MDLAKIERLIRILESSSLSEIEIEEEGLRVRLQKPQLIAAAIPVAAPLTGQVNAVGAPELAVAPVGEPAEEEEIPTIDSPMVGTFYAAPAPGEPPFVQVGDRVEVDQTVCIVEAMKLMNEVGAKFPCIIEKLLVENGEPVEFGQSLFAVRPVEQV